MKKTVKNYSPACRLIENIGSRWALLALFALHEHGTLRFGELRRKMDGVSERMLASTLDALENEGLVCRRVYAEVPPRVEYAVTARGEELLPIVRQLVEWAENTAGSGL